jgi:hypothetical protein
MSVLTRFLVVLLLIPMLQANSAADTHRISADEREALEALYKATNGPTWIHRDGWLGPSGSECDWYGVVCSMDLSGGVGSKLVVIALELGDNGLTGRLPPEVRAFKGLKHLILRGNAVKGPIADILLQRWDEGQLEINPLSLTHDVEEVLVDVSNPALLCGGYKVKMTAEGTVHSERKLCRARHGKQTREVYCEYRQGKTLEFDLLGRFLVRSGFFADPEPLAGTEGQDIGITNIAATRGSGVHRSRSDPSISIWAVGAILEGIIARVKWTAPATTSSCSSK